MTMPVQMAPPPALDFDAWFTRAAARARAAGEPEWAAEQRRIAAAAAVVLPFPGREDELWRRTDFRTLEAAIGSLEPFVSGAPARSLGDLPEAVRDRLAEDAGAAAIVVQHNRDVVFESVPEELARQGVTVCSLEHAFAHHGSLLQAHYGSLIDGAYDRWTAIGSALHAGGVFVHVPDGVQAALPIRFVQWLDAPGVIAATRSVVVLGRNAQATVIDEQLSQSGNGITSHLGGTEVFVGDDSRLVFATLQDWDRNVYEYSNHRARIGRGAELQWVQTVLGSRMAKANAYFDLAGPGAQAFVHGFMFGDSRQHFHVHTLQRHLVDHTTSDLLIKSCLKDRARSVYQGLIQVSEGAQRTDAYQANRNLLLSDQARADSIPGLEILANDVRCTHGATIGHVDDEQMYYLMARGLPRLEAQRLIVEGFFAPVLDRIPLDRVREALRREIERKIG